MRLSRLSFVLALGALFAAPASAQQYTAQVRAQLDRAQRTLRGEGYSRVRAYTTGSLGDGDDQAYRVTLQRGYDYVFTGACDSDCSDLDFWLYDNNGNLIDSDTAADDVPVVRVTPARNGTFTIRVGMAACSAAPCYHGFGLFRQ
jgi:hypothetical protein